MDPIRKRELILRKFNNDIAHREDLNQGPLSDLQIEDIARLNPLKLEDLKAVKNLRTNVIESYGIMILEVLASIQQDVDLYSEASIANTLSELQKKLINLSKRNRLLYLARANTASAIDLFKEDESSLFDLLFDNKSIQLIKLDENSSLQDKAKFSQIQKLVANLRKQQRETGQNDLYIGYPFTMGQFVLDPFTIRAPLALFGVEAKITNNSITLSRNENSEILLNTNLLVATQKFTNNYKDLIDPEIEEANRESFIDDLLAIYAQEGLIIERKRPEALIKFQSYLAEEFPEQVAGSFNLEPVMVLGNFPNYATALQRDFSKIIQLDVYPQHVLDLLSSVGQSGYEEAISDEVVEPNIRYQEADVVNISQLNASQEKALMMVKKGQNLVIEGPPGTGKSQTITNIIASALDQKKNVLMVSEKKAAIDVVYSRLGNLNRYALILDNMNDKVRFYDQLQHLFSNSEVAENVDNEFRINQTIQAQYDQLENLANLLVQNIDGTTLLDLYRWVKPLEYETPQGFETYDFYKKHVDTHYLAQPLGQLQQEVEKILGLEDRKTQNSLLKLRQENSFLKHLKHNLTSYDVRLYHQELIRLRDQYQAYQSKSMLARVFSKNPAKADAEALMNKLFDKAVDADDVISLSHVLEVVLDKYTAWISMTNDNPEQQIQISQQIEVIAKHFNVDFGEAAKRFINFLGFEKINSFEHQHRQLITTINNFNQIVASIKTSGREKEAVVQKRLAQQLIASIDTMNQSRRTKEIQRIIERKRKWPISKFIDRFYVELFSGIKVWLCTPEVVSDIFPLKQDLFDVLIYDEASQIYVEKAIGSLMRSKQVVVAGDSQQLRPSSLGFGRFDYADEAIDDFIETTAALDEESLLDLARFKFDSTILNYHYRSQFEELIAFSNVAFYRDQLIIAPNKVAPSSPAIEVIKIEDGLWEQRRNQAEAKRVVELVDQLLKTRSNQETIGIITFNVTQQNLINDLLNQHAQEDKEFSSIYLKEINRIEDGEDKSLFVKNIENVQGDERDIIIFSITYAQNKDGKVSTNFGWLNQQGGQNRLNVAITRSKRKIYIVTSIMPFELQVDQAANLGPKIFRDYLAYAFAISNQDYETVRTLFKKYGQVEKTVLPATDDAKIKKLFERLVEDGYQVHENLGLGQFRIAAAIAKDNQYLLALEFDRELYRQPDARVRDVHQGTYLTVRGWPIKRIFSRDLYQDFEKTYRSILELLHAKRIN